jgi:UDP-glucose 4-epimerase
LKDKNVRYIKGNTQNIEKYLHKYKKKILTIFHFGEFSRIYQSFIQFEKCLEYNVLGSKSVFNFCLKNKIKLIYSATSATIGNKGNDKNLSPYAYTKNRNLEFLENLKKWFNFKFEIIYFYNVYGKNHIKEGEMATIIGIFETQFLKSKPLSVVRPGTQTRRFTHISDTIDVCIDAWKKNKCKHYSIAAKKNYSILQIAKLFGGKIKFLPKRPGERYASALTKMYLSNKVINKIGKRSIKSYITKFKETYTNE